MQRIEEFTSSPYQVKEIPQVKHDAVTAAFESPARRKHPEGKRRASECLKPHLLVRDCIDVSDTENAAILRRSENMSMPTLSYSRNGLKRNKSNELTQEMSQTFGLRRSAMPRSISQANATFDNVAKSPSSFQTNPLTGLLRRGPASSSSFPVQNPLNASFSVTSRRQSNPFLDKVMNAICEESSTSAAWNSNEIMENDKAPSASEPYQDSGVTSSSNCATSTLDNNHPQHGPKGFHPSEEIDRPPQVTLISMLQEAGYQAQSRKSSELNDYFLQYTEEDIAAYDQEVINAIRSKNIPLLRALKAKGKTLQCANRYGESLVHMACRRGMTDVVRFLILEAKVSLRVKDDYGRTPLHDACWSAEPNFELMDFLIEQEADLLLIEDKRGHFPFSYARRSHWEGWNKFLLSRKGNIRLRTFQEPLSSHVDSSTIIG